MLLGIALIYLFGNQGILTSLGIAIAAVREGWHHYCGEHLLLSGGDNDPDGGVFRGGQPAL